MYTDSYSTSTMVKDRLPELKKIQAEIAMEENEEETANYCPLDQKCVALGSVLKQAADIQDSIKHLKSFVKSAKKIQSDIEISPMERNQLQQKLCLITDSFMRLASRIRVNLRSIQPEAKCPHQRDMIGRIKALHCQTLTQQFFTIMNDYNTAEEKHQQRCQLRLQRHMTLLGECTVTEARLQELKQKDIHIFNIKYGSCNQLGDHTKQYTNIQQRHSDFMGLESGLTDLHALFMDLHKIVYEQGGLVDNIEHHVCSTQCCVQTATLKFRKAQQYKRKNPAKRVLLLPFQIVKRIALH